MQKNLSQNQEFHGTVRRLARWLNRGSFGKRQPAHYIELVGGRLLGTIGRQKSARFYGFGDEGAVSLLWEIDGLFMSGEQVSLILSTAIADYPPDLNVLEIKGSY